MRVDLVNFRGAGQSGSSVGLLAEWRVGAILPAVAVRDATKQLWLNIGDTRYPARIASGDETGPAHGERLQVRVLRTSPVLALETLPAAETTDAEAATVTDALRRHMPRQASAALMLANLGWLAAGKTKTEALPTAVIQAAAKLWESLPDVKTLADPKALENAILRSGAFLEAHLSNGDRATAATVAAGDLKALMLSLSRSLREHGARPAAARADTAMHAPLPTAAGPLTSLPASPATFALIESSNQHMHELARQTDGALSRLTALQLANGSQDNAVQSLLIELPVRHEDRSTMLRLRIGRDGGRGGHESAESSWTVEAALDLGAIGPLHARVSLTGQRIGVQLRAASAAVVDLLSARSSELEAMLRGAGLEVDRVVCLHGMPAGDSGARQSRLLDVRA